MPWYGNNLIARMRNEAAATERSQRQPAGDDAKALPVLVVVAIWAMAAAAFRSGVDGAARWDIVINVASAPLLMGLIGAVWGSHRSSLPSGLDAAIVTGAVLGLLYFLGLSF